MAKREKASSAIRLSRSVELFFTSHHNKSQTVLIGFSGGHDSRALFEILAHYFSKKNLTQQLVVAHVDHGWRQESAQEAETLKKMVEGRGFLFRSCVLPAHTEGNLEEWCRKERYLFFQNLYNEYGCQALVLGHQADDQAETVLKRVFEGAHFSALGAMSTVSYREGMQIWRPLLEFGKQEILEYLREKEIQALDDKTNYDPTFLRARMRKRVIPMLEETFGKKIRDNLLEFSKYFHELRAYFEGKSFPYLRKIHREEESVSLDFSSFICLPSLEVEFALKLFFHQEGLKIGTRHLKQLVRHILEGARDKMLHVQKRCILVNKKKLTLYLNSSSLLPKETLQDVFNSHSS